MSYWDLLPKDIKGVIMGMKRDLQVQEDMPKIIKSIQEREHPLLLRPIRRQECGCEKSSIMYGICHYARLFGVFTFDDIFLDMKARLFFNCGNDISEDTKESFVLDFLIGNCLCQDGGWLAIQCKHVHEIIAVRYIGGSSGIYCFLCYKRIRTLIEKYKLQVHLYHGRKYDKCIYYLVGPSHVCDENCSYL